jgi:outer membrane protein TolC
MKIKNRNFFLTILSLMCLFRISAQGQTDSTSSLKVLLQSAIAHSQQVKNQAILADKSKLDQKKALQTYLPKITAEASYTHLNDDINLPEDMITLLESTQRLLIKEGVAMQLASLGMPSTEKYFGVPYKADASNPAAPGSILMKTVNEKFKNTPPIQKQDIIKTSISAQMVLFSGMKVPYLIQASKHQTAMYELLGKKEEASIINSVVSTYYKLAVIYKSEEVLTSTDKYLTEQTRFVEKAKKSGLATDLELQKIELAKQQLKAKQIELATNKKLLFARLGQLTGLSSTSFETMKAILPELIEQADIADASQREDLKALDEAIKATDYKRKSEYTEYVPKVFAFGKKELRTNDLSTFDPKWLVGVGIKWTLFDGLTSVTNAKQAKLDRIVLENKREEAKELLDLNLLKSKFEVEKCQQLLAVAAQQVKTTEKSYEISQKQYQNGLITMNDHLASINEVEKAKLEEIKALYELNAAALNLQEAAGILKVEMFK